MSTYIPDGWVVIKLTGTDPHYRVFGSWRGNFTDPEKWRLNSGIVKCSYGPWDGLSETYKFDGFSGSIYYCNKSSYGMIGAYNLSVLGELVKKSNNLMEVLDDRDDWTTMDWIIK